MNVKIITNSIFNSRTYVFFEDDSNAAYIVDCGDVDKVIEMVGGRKVEGVLLTHAHFDHIYGLPYLLEKFPNVAIYTNEWGKRALADEKLNMSRYYENPVRVDCANVQIVHDGEKVCGLDTYETPGHNPSCICYTNCEMIFTGDAYIPGSKMVTNLPYCDKALSEESEKRIMRIAEGKSVYPGHSV